MRNKLTDNNTLKLVLRIKDFYTKKGLGQNFLINEQVAREIIESLQISSEDIVIEIGPGVGSLTQYLVEKTPHVLAVEIDKKAIPLLRENVQQFGSLSIVEGDILKIDLEKSIKSHFGDLKKKIKVVANLPYYITTPILMLLLEKYDFIESITVMVQKEVGERMIAEAGTKAYGALTLAINYHTECVPICSVDSQSFYPAPKVDSMVLKMNIRQQKLLSKEVEKIFFQLVRCGFNQRRKTLSNSLLPFFMGDKEETRAFLKSLNIDEKRRGETLKKTEYIQMANVAWKEF